MLERHQKDSQGRRGLLADAEVFGTDQPSFQPRKA